jgi:hypothetical protein
MRSRCDLTIYEYSLSTEDCSIWAHSFGLEHVVAWDKVEIEPVEWMESRHVNQSLQTVVATEVFISRPCDCLKHDGRPDCVLEVIDAKTRQPWSGKSIFRGS